MKRASAILILVLILLGCSRHAGPTLPAEAISARMGPARVFAYGGMEVGPSADDPSRFLYGTTRLAPHGKYSSEDFYLTWELTKEEQAKFERATRSAPPSKPSLPAVGIVDEGGMYHDVTTVWFLNEERRQKWITETQDKPANIEVVFIVSANLGQATLEYKLRPAGNPFSIAR